jgi:hypothetical protein
LTKIIGRRVILYDSKLWRVGQRLAGVEAYVAAGGCRGCVGFPGYSIPV